MVGIIAIITLMNDLTLYEFILVRQAIFLTIDTFGFSHVLPILGLPFLVVHQNTLSKKKSFLMRLSQVSQITWSLFIYFIYI
jgi:hypothetical protein